MIRHLLALALAVSGLQADPEPWKRVLLPEGMGMVSCMAVGQDNVAFGSVSGGVQLLDRTMMTKSVIRDPVLGKTGRIHALVWGGRDLWVASEGGLYRWDGSTGQLEKSRKDVPASLRSGVTAMSLVGSALWCATSKSVATFDPSRKESLREWKTPIQDEPTVLLRVGGRILVGTNTKGLLLLDSASGSWIRLGRSDGLSSDQITGLEWVGAEVYVATPEGLDVLDLSTQKVHSMIASVSASWTAQSNGTLFVATVDGLLKVDATTHSPSILALLDNSRPEGAVLAKGGRLMVSVAGAVLVRDQPSIFGEDGFRLVPQGFTLELPGRIPSGIQVQAFLRIPEWPEAKVALTVDVADGGSRLLVRTPSDMRGPVQIDLVAFAGSKVEEIRSLESIGDRAKPSLVLDAFRTVLRDSVAEISGKAAGVGELALTLSPGGNRLAIGADGSFRQKLTLRHGESRFSLRLDDAIGNNSVREIVFRRDDRSPVFEPVSDDTVAGDFSRIRVKFHETGAVKATVRGTGNLKVAVYDSFVVLEARKLAVGVNSIQILLEDEAGNLASKIVQVFRRSAAYGGQVNSWSLENLSSAETGTYRASTGDFGGSVHVVQYKMVEGETLCGVAEMFYGTQGLAEVLIRWNGFADSSQWRRMPVGTPVDVPFWRDLDYRNPDVKGALESFPWDRIPLVPRTRK
jgi:hypothetical protein